MADETQDQVVDLVRTSMRNLLVEIEHGCEQSARLAESCAAEAVNGSAHSPEWFLGWRAAMLATAEQMRLVANGKTLGSPHMATRENVIPLRNGAGR